MKHVTALQGFACGKPATGNSQEAMMRDDAITCTRITDIVEKFVSGPVNNLHMPGGFEPAFGQPLLGFASGGDSLWTEFKKHIGEFHWTPVEAFRLAYPGENPSPEELTVVSWILPQTTSTRKDQRKQKTYPSERWARNRIMGEQHVNQGLRKHLPDTLASRGVQALAPMLLPEWSRVECDKLVYASTWSERHAAYVAGLGTFGLCDGLITPVGKSMRTGSVIMRAALPPSPRPYSSHREYCLFFNSGTCGKCIKRCPVGALSADGHDKRRCREFLQGTTRPYVNKTYHFDGYGCGLCQVGVPCETGIPRVRRESAISSAN
ncbi:MAG: 4Fe-4S ferredoxin [Desulfovibrio sp.]|jgi:epoxyqueuosine reductase QueG|nr:4Fe-4S ferredoxin [Desulfovibrio sp.]